MSVKLKYTDINLINNISLNLTVNFKVDDEDFFFRKIPNMLKKV